MWPVPYSKPDTCVILQKSRWWEERHGIACPFSPFRPSPSPRPTFPLPHLLVDPRVPLLLRGKGVVAPPLLVQLLQLRLRCVQLAPHTQLLSLGRGVGGASLGKKGARGVRKEIISGGAGERGRGGPVAGWQGKGCAVGRQRCRRSEPGQKGREGGGGREGSATGEKRGRGGGGKGEDTGRAGA